MSNFTLEIKAEYHQRILNTIRNFGGYIYTLEQIFGMAKNDPHAFGFSSAQRQITQIGDTLLRSDWEPLPLCYFGSVQTIEGYATQSPASEGWVKKIAEAGHSHVLHFRDEFFAIGKNGAQVFDRETGALILDIPKKGYPYQLLMPLTRKRNIRPLRPFGPEHP
jgi:hypothetical protein